jgi:transcriptional regulator with XRE-family HTH domain
MSQITRRASRAGQSPIGVHLKQIRLARDESQEAIARRANISTATYSRIENGHNEPSVDTLRRLAGALDVTVDELIGGPIKAA